MVARIRRTRSAVRLISTLAPAVQLSSPIIQCWCICRRACARHTGGPLVQVPLCVTERHAVCDQNHTQGGGSCGKRACEGQRKEWGAAQLAKRGGHAARVQGQTTVSLILSSLLPGSEGGGILCGPVRRRLPTTQKRLGRATQTRPTRPACFWRRRAQRDNATATCHTCCTRQRPTTAPSTPPRFSMRAPKGGRPPLPPTRPAC